MRRWRSDEGEEEDIDGYKSNDDEEEESIGDLDGFYAWLQNPYIRMLFTHYYFIMLLKLNLQH